MVNSAGLRTPGPPVLNRRRLLSLGGAVGAGALLAACGSGSESSGGESSGGADKGAGPWSFTDDRGKAAKADRTPERVVAYVGSAAALHDFGVEVSGVFGPTKRPDGKPDVQVGTLDVSKLTVIGNEYGDFGIEKYAALRPELLVTNMNVPPGLWYVPEESAGKIEQLAPTVGIRTAGTSLLKAIERYGELAAGLGADLEAQRVTAAKTRFEAAARTLRDAAKARRGVRVMAASGSADLLWVGIADDFADLRYYKELGVEFVTPDKPEKGGFWESLSWENVGKYEADLIMVDVRTGNLQPDELAKSKPTWRDLPAVKAGRITGWQNEAQHSYAGYAPVMEELAEALTSAGKAA